MSRCAQLSREQGHSSAPRSVWYGHPISRSPFAPLDLALDMARRHSQEWKSFVLEERQSLERERAAEEVGRAEGWKEGYETATRDRNCE